MAAGPILVVDDDEPRRLAVTADLEDAGYFVVGAGSAEAGLAALEEIHPTLVLLATPSEDGQTLIEDVRAQGLTFALCLLGGVPEHEEWAADVGAEVLPEPYSPDDLLAKVEELAGPPE